MNIEDFRNYCLSFDGVHDRCRLEKRLLNTTGTYWFYVADKWFVFVNIDVFDFCCIKK